jgi:hypothetical protein
MLITAQTIFSDNFNRTTIGSNWIIGHGNWSIENNKLKHVGDGSGDDNFIIYVKDTVWTQYTIECKVMWGGGGFFEDGITFFHKPSATTGIRGNYFFATLTDYLGNEARLSRSTFSKWSIVSYPSLDSSVTTNKWFNLKVKIEKVSPTGCNVEYYVFNKLILRIQGDVDSLLSDKIGLGGNSGQWGQTVYFDDFIVYGPAGPTTTSLESPIGNSPNNFKLGQNYPNPFNPSTKIEYEIAQASNVKISIYDIAGQLVKELFNEQKNTGKYSIIWDGKDNLGNLLASGTYLYQIQTNDFVQSKKMILLK